MDTETKCKKSRGSDLERVRSVRKNV